MSLQVDRRSLASLSDYIRVYDYELSKQAALVSRLGGWQTHTWYDPATDKNYSEQEKELEVRHIADQPEIFTALTNIVVDACKRYSEDVMILSRINAVSPVRLNRYPSGSLMRPHVDHIHSIFDGQAKGVPVISVVGLLNEDYQGGKFKICERAYHLKAGQIIVWPSCFLFPHEVTEVTDGTRYSFVSWGW